VLARLSLPGSVTAAIAVAIAAALGASCERPEPASARKIDPALIEKLDGALTIRTDTVGHDQWASVATFALVDAENTGEGDALVTLGGALLDAQGNEIGPVRLESLRIPPGARRTFALIDAEQKPRPEATGARVEVTGAFAPTYSNSITINTGRVYVDQDRMLIAGTVTNTAAAAVKVLIFAAFHDDADHPMTRPFTLVQLGGGQQQTVDFVGPVGSKKAYLFVGDAVY
jgi:hypothetical protein